MQDLHSLTHQCFSVPVYLRLEIWYEDSLKMCNKKGFLENPTGTPVTGKNSHGIFLLRLAEINLNGATAIKCRTSDIKSFQWDTNSLHSLGAAHISCFRAFITYTLQLTTGWSHLFVLMKGHLAWFHAVCLLQIGPQCIHHVNIIGFAAGDAVLLA